MKKYAVEIVMTTSRSTVVYVDAEDGDDAISKAETIFENECPTAPLDWTEGDIESVIFFDEEIQ